MTDEIFAYLATFVIATTTCFAIGVMYSLVFEHKWRFYVVIPSTMIALFAAIVLITVNSTVILMEYPETSRSVLKFLKYDFFPYDPELLTRK